MGRNKKNGNGQANKSLQDMTLPEALQEIQRLEASKQDLLHRNFALCRSRAAMVRNNAAKLAAHRVLNVVEEWEIKRADMAENRLDVEYAEFQHQLERELADLREQLVNGAANGEMPGAHAEVATAATQGSVSQLRLVMTNPNATTEELRSAILSVEAMVNEAKRELERKEFRQRRAAYEQLAGATEKAEDNILEMAIEAAKEANVDQEDVEKAEQKLVELRMLSPKERAARNARRSENEMKKSGFVLVKQNNVLALIALLDDLDDESKWKDWRDHQARSLVDFAKFLGFSEIEEALRQRCNFGEDGSSSSASSGETADQSCEDTAEEQGEEVLSTSETEAEETGSAQEVAAVEPCQIDESKHQLTAEEEERFKKQAFAAVVQEKIDELEEMVKVVSHTTWQEWTNKGGKNLLTLCEERGRKEAETILRKAIPGMVKKISYPRLEERQAVWVFESGRVQPRQATVVEETAADAEEVLIEFWDGTEDAQYVARCLIRE